MLQYNIKELLIKEGIIDKGFYGKVILVFEKGKVIYLRKEETIHLKEPKSSG